MEQNYKSSVQQTSHFELSRQHILYAVALLGIFSILSGVGLIVAANWAIIPEIVKVGGGLVVLALSLAAVSYFHTVGRPRWKESFLFISFCLIGGNIALIQQTYNLSISWSQGSFFWWGLSLPLVFITRHKILPICSVILFGVAFWDWLKELLNLDYMILSGVLFLLMMLTHFVDGKFSKFLRTTFFTAAIFILLIGDITSRSGAGVVGFLTTVLFLFCLGGSPRDTNALVKDYNKIFIFVAWRIFLLFWNAYYNLEQIGILLVVFGAILLTGVGLYTYFYDQIQQAIRKMVGVNDKQ